MNLDLVHQMRGKLVVYVLALEPDSEGREFRYVGTTQNLERRMAEHTGVKKGGAAWCAKHKPVDIISVKVCQTTEEAAAMEVMLCSMHQAQIGYQQVRGGRWNMPGDMRRKPPHFEAAEEYYMSPRSTASTTASDEGTTEPEPENKWKPPALDTSVYHKIREENGITEEKPPVSCLIFKNEKDPEGRLRHLAGLVAS